MRRKIHDNPGLAEGYLWDLIAIIKEDAFDAIEQYNKAGIKGKDYSKDPNYDEAYNCGYAYAYSFVISLMLRQAESFDIPLSDLGLDGIDRDKDLMDGV